jgi:hypothetical protein
MKNLSFMIIYVILRGLLCMWGCVSINFVAFSMSSNASCYRYSACYHKLFYICCVALRPCGFGLWINSYLIFIMIQMKGVFIDGSRCMQSYNILYSISHATWVTLGCQCHVTLINHNITSGQKNKKKSLSKRERRKTLVTL